MKTTWLFLTGALALAVSVSCALAQMRPVLGRVPAPIDESQVVTLDGNVHPFARPEFEIGDAPRGTRLDRMLLLLKPTSSQQSALDALLAAQQDPRSPLYHCWLTPSDYAARFGPNPNDLNRITSWLHAHGFNVNEIPAGHQLVIFSGTADQVFEAFHTDLRRYRVHGEVHLANSLAPQIPKALANVVSGIVSLHDFRRRSAMRAVRSAGARPQWNLYGSHYLFPADFAAIYNLNSVYDAGATGSGTSVAIAGRSDIRLADVAAFRADAALPPASPQIVFPALNPGLVNGDQDEATLDVEWAGALAPAAAVTLVAAASTATTDGVDLAAAWIVNHAAAQVVSVSYGSCEQAMGATELAFYNSLWQQAATQGMSVFVASGDSGAAGCDLGSASTGTVAAVNGLCSSPFATCVGGTEFNEGFNPAQYWSLSNGPGRASALAYIPETAWNESALQGGAGLWATGGGASAIYPQPAWQRDAAGAAAANGMRAVPDVSLTAAGHDGYMIFENGSYWIVSGTSAAAPSFAALMALVVQAQHGANQGSANPTLYGMLNASQNPFHRTIGGDNSVPGVPGFSATGADYNLATGLGSVDARVLLDRWNQSGPVAVPRIVARGTPIPVRTRSLHSSPFQTLP